MLEVDASALPAVAAATRVPPSTVVAPLNVLAPVRMSVPAPVLRKATFTLSAAVRPVIVPANVLETPGPGIDGEDACSTDAAVFDLSGRIARKRSDAVAKSSQIEDAARVQGQSCLRCRWQPIVSSQFQRAVVLHGRRSVVRARGAQDHRRAIYHEIGIR